MCLQSGEGEYLSVWVWGCDGPRHVLLVPVNPGVTGPVVIQEVPAGLVRIDSPSCSLQKAHPIRKTLLGSVQDVFAGILLAFSPLLVLLVINPHEADHNQGDKGNAGNHGCSKTLFSHA